MKKTYTLLYILATLLIMAVFAVCLATFFPYTIRMMEADDLWLMTRYFWQLKLTTLPAVSWWITDFVVQFYSNVYFAAVYEAMLLGIISLLAHRALRVLCGKRQWLTWAGLLPAFFLAWYCTFQPCLFLQVAFLFAMLNVFALPVDWRARLAWAVASVPAGFLLMTTPLLAILFVLYAVTEVVVFGRGKLAWMLLPLPLLGVTPLIYSQQVAFIPFSMRYTYTGILTKSISDPYFRRLEQVYSYVILSNERRWKELLCETPCRKLAVLGDPFALRYALLAESALGTLPENLFNYAIRSEDQFLFRHESSDLTLPFNRLFFENLGIWDEAYHHAEEYANLKPNGQCFSSLRRMTDYSIAEQEWEVAEKYLRLLSHSTCHRDFVSERREMMARERKKPQMQKPLWADNFVGGYAFDQEMLRLCRYYQDDERRKKMLDYAICTYLIHDDMRRFSIALYAYGFYKGKPLPQAYASAVERIMNMNVQQ